LEVKEVIEWIEECKSGVDEHEHEHESGTETLQAFITREVVLAASKIDRDAAIHSYFKKL